MVESEQEGRLESMFSNVWDIGGWIFVPGKAIKDVVRKTPNDAKERCYYPLTQSLPQPFLLVHKL